MAILQTLYHGSRIRTFNFGYDPICYYYITRIPGGGLHPPHSLFLGVPCNFQGGVQRAHLIVLYYSYDNAVSSLLFYNNRKLADYYPTDLEKRSAIALSIISSDIPYP